VDAVTRLWTLLWTLMRERLVIPIAVSMFYVAAVMVALLMQSNGRGVLVAVLCAIPAAALLAILTERVARYTLSAAALGLPQHSHTMRNVQLLALCIIAMPPFLIALMCGGAPLPSAATLAGGIAVGMAARMYPGLFVPAIFISLGLKGQFGPPERWLALPQVQWAILAGACVLTWRWLDFSARLQRRFGELPGIRADAKHEGSKELSVDEAAALAAESKWVDAAIQGISPAQGASPARISADALTFCLGYSTAPRWRLLGSWVIVGVSALAVLHVWRRALVDLPAYWIASGVACLSIFSYADRAMRRWRVSVTEQALLSITPCWPNARTQKMLVLQSMLRLCIQGAIMSAAWTAFDFMLGFITAYQAACGGLVVFAGGCAAVGTSCTALSMPRMKPLSLGVIVIGVATACGAALIAFGSQVNPGYTVAGAIFLLLPTAVAVSRYLALPLHFPIDSATALPWNS
jgi:hypothetical protein